MIIKTGEVLMFSGGDYSDYGVTALAVALKDFDGVPPDMPIESEYGSSELLWLTLGGYVREIPYVELRGSGDYSGYNSGVKPVFKMSVRRHGRTKTPGVDSE